jgi:hypothetical protein
VAVRTTRGPLFSGRDMGMVQAGYLEFMGLGNS